MIANYQTRKSPSILTVEVWLMRLHVDGLLIPYYSSNSWPGIGRLITVSLKDQRRLVLDIC